MPTESSSAGICRRVVASSPSHIRSSTIGSTPAGRTCAGRSASKITFSTRESHDYRNSALRTAALSGQSARSVDGRAEPRGQLLSLRLPPVKVTASSRRRSGPFDCEDLDGLGYALEIDRMRCGDRESRVHTLYGLQAGK